MGQKFQPKISPENSGKISFLPKSFLEVGKYRSLEELTLIADDPTKAIFYVLSDSSSNGRLIPLRDSKKGKFLTIVLSRK